jgi:alkylhydroperoxidase family enzyme
MVDQALDDHLKAPISDKLRAMLGFIEKLTLAPEALTKDDASALREAGVKKGAAEDAIYVALLFCIYNRMADALGFTLPDDNYEMAPKILLSFIGYR